MTTSYISVANSNPATGVSSRRTAELVIGLVGPVGSGISKTAELLLSQFKERFSYQEEHYIRVSDIIRERAEVMGIEVPDSGADRIGKFRR